MVHMKVKELKGVKNLLRIECTCSGLAIWIRYDNRAFDQRTRRNFIRKHAEHDVHSFTVRSVVF